MSRPLRLEFPGAIYHVTSRGDRREPIYRDDVDRQMQLEVLAQAMDRFDAEVLAWCQMGTRRAAHAAAQPVATDAACERCVHAGLQPAA